MFNGSECFTHNSFKPVSFNGIAVFSADRYPYAGAIFNAFLETNGQHCSFKAFASSDYLGKYHFGSDFISRGEWICFQQGRNQLLDVVYNSVQQRIFSISAPISQHIPRAEV